MGVEGRDVETLRTGGGAVEVRFSVLGRAGLRKLREPGFNVEGLGLRVWV